MTASFSRAAIAEVAPAAFAVTSPTNAGANTPATKARATIAGLLIFLNLQNLNNAVNERINLAFHVTATLGLKN